MSNDASFVGSIPEFYDKGLGPIIFADQAAEMAKRVAVHDPQRVLETAGGTGIVSRELRNHLGAGATSDRHRSERADARDRAHEIPD